jgi:hypothetical protein
MVRCCRSDRRSRCGICRPRAAFKGGIASCARSYTTRLRSRSWCAVVGATAGRDAAYAGRGLRSRVKSRAALAPTPPGSGHGQRALLQERPQVAMWHMPAAGCVRGRDRELRSLLHHPAPVTVSARCCRSDPKVAMRHVPAAGCLRGRDRELRSLLHHPAPVTVSARCCRSDRRSRCGVGRPPAQVK